MLSKSPHPASAVLQRSRLSFAASSSASPSMSTAEAPPRPRQPRPPAPPAYFPQGFKDAAYQWWTDLAPSMAEKTVLSFVPHLREAVGSGADAAPDPFGACRVWRRSLVQLSGKNRALNEVCVERVGERVNDTLVMIHGYGAGLGFFYKNLEPVSRVPGLRLYALDMLGMGNSSRPSFKIHAKDRDQQVVEAENWFIDALEEWRKARRVDRFTLLGHSLGGYLAVSYAIKYPGRLKKLILASPVGIPEDPYAVSAAMPEPHESTLQHEFARDQQSVSETPPTGLGPRDANANPAAPKRPLPSWLVWLWDANISPFSIVRMTGPLGPRFVSGWSSRRFNHLPPAEARALHEYSFSIFKQKGSGEYALAYILAPGAYARRPIINRIHQVGRQVLPGPPSAAAAAAAGLGDAASPPRETGIPVVFMYGENDWMDVAGGLAAKEKLKAAKVEALLRASDEDRRSENGSARVIIVPKAGHHLYLDNPDHFNEVLRQEIEATRRAESDDKTPTAS